MESITKWEDVTREYFETLKLKTSDFKVINGVFVLIVSGNAKDAIDASSTACAYLQSQMSADHWGRIFITALLPDSPLTENQKAEFESDMFASNKFIISSIDQIDSIVGLHLSWIESLKSLLEAQEKERVNHLLEYKLK